MILIRYKIMTCINKLKLLLKIDFFLILLSIAAINVIIIFIEYSKRSCIYYFIDSVGTKYNKERNTSLRKVEGRECGVGEVGRRERPGRRCVVALVALHGTVSAG